MESTAKITKSLRKEDAHADWWIVDATGQTLGRLASQVAFLIRGKHKPSYTPHVDGGDYVIVINTDKIVLHAMRADKKDYFHYTGYPGGGRTQAFKDIMPEKSGFVIEHAVKGMLPKTKLGRKMIKKLKVFRTEEHTHAAQMPKDYTLKY